MEQDKSIFKLEVDVLASAHLRDASRWAKFIALIGFSSLVLFLFFLIIFGPQYMEGISMLVTDSQELVIVFTIIIILVFILLGTLCLFLLRGANKTRRGLTGKDQKSFNEGLVYFRNYFMMYGIISVLVLFFNLFRLFS